MELDANPADPLPVNAEPQERVSCTLSQVDLLRRILAWQIFRYDLPHNFSFGKFELDNALVETLLIKQDSAGNAFVSISDAEMGS